MDSVSQLGARQMPLQRDLLGGWLRPPPPTHITNLYLEHRNPGQHETVCHTLVPWAQPSSARTIERMVVRSAPVYSGSSAPSRDSASNVRLV